MPANNRHTFKILMEQTQSASTSENIFELDGKQYKIIIPQVNIPGIGILTAAEILLSAEAQEYLVKEKCIGSVISEHFEVAEKTPPVE